MLHTTLLQQLFHSFRRLLRWFKANTWASHALLTITLEIIIRLSILHTTGC